MDFQVPRIEDVKKFIALKEKGIEYMEIEYYDKKDGKNKKRG